MGARISTEADINADYIHTRLMYFTKDGECRGVVPKIHWQTQMIVAHEGRLEQRSCCLDVLIEVQSRIPFTEGRG